MTASVPKEQQLWLRKEIKGHNQVKFHFTSSHILRESATFFKGQNLYRFNMINTCVMQYFFYETE